MSIEDNDAILHKCQVNNNHEYYGEIAKVLKNSGELEAYKQACRKFIFFDTVFSSSKSKQFFENSLKEVHPSIKLGNSKKTKYILRSICKVFLQDLAEQCVIVAYESDKSLIDVDIVNEAYRKLSSRKDSQVVMRNIFH